MELKTYLTILRKHWRVVVAATAVVFVLALLLSRYVSAKYQAIVILRVPTPLGGSLTDVYYQTEFATRLMNTYVQVATSESMTSALKVKLGLKTLPDITVRIIPDSEIMQILVVSTDPALAAKTANALGDLLINSQTQQPESSSDVNAMSLLQKQRDVLLSSLTDSETQNDRLVQDYAQTSAEIAILDKKIAIQEATLQSQRPVDATQIQQQLDPLYKQYQTLVAISNMDAQQIALIRQTIQNQQSSYSDMVIQYNNALASSSRQSTDGKVMVVSSAMQPTKPISPGRTFVLGLGILCGLIVGIFLAFIRENFTA